MSSPASVQEVVTRMEAIVAPLSRSDGVGCFTRLYLAVTQGVQERLVGVAFVDPAFLARLDIVFANLFFTALEQSQRDPGKAPHAWRPLFESRSRHGIAPLQFAFAGMNAHINRDLPVALVTTCREFGIGLDSGSPQHQDFERINGLLATVETQIKQQYMTGWLRTVDRLIHRVSRIDDIVAMWAIQHAREAAWINAQALWAIRDNADLSVDFVAALDGTVGFAARGLLIPADTWLQKLGRTLHIG